MTSHPIALRYPRIQFDMPIMDSILELERLRYQKLQGTTHPTVFFQLKHIFQMLESIGSSRIEGNNTTIMDYVESSKLQTTTPKLFDNQEQITEIENIEKAMQYIEANIESIDINHIFIRELHTLVVKDLNPRHEGATSPGTYRSGPIFIAGAQHTPPDALIVPELMDELLDFVNQRDAPKYDLLRIALAHHRFVWIHPFENGNGRVVRLFTYALLLKFVFTSNQRIINPTAVFCSDRNLYYYKLAQADTGTDAGYIEWTEYMLTGMKTELEKIDKLVDYNYLSRHVLKPMLSDALQNQYITLEDNRILTIAIEKQIIQAADLKTIFPDKTPSEISRSIRNLINKKMLIPIHPNARKYTLSFSNSYLLRSILRALDNQGFLPQQTVSLLD